jgi:hypothetical protein
VSTWPADEAAAHRANRWSRDGSAVQDIRLAKAANAVLNLVAVNSAPVADVANLLGILGDVAVNYFSDPNMCRNVELDNLLRPYCPKDFSPHS